MKNFDIEVISADSGRAEIRVGNRFLIFIPGPKGGARKIVEFTHAQVDSGEVIPGWLLGEATKLAAAVMKDHERREERKAAWQKAQPELPFSQPALF